MSAKLGSVNNSIKNVGIKQRENAKKRIVRTGVIIKKSNAYSV